MKKLIDLLWNIDTHGTLSLTRCTDVIALGALLENGTEDIVTTADWEQWKKLAARIAAAMAENDEPAFSLHDYLDAIINAPNAEDVDALLAMDADEFFRDIRSLARSKRRTYEG